LCKNTRYSTKNGDRCVFLEDTVKSLTENILSLETDVPDIPKKLKSLVASEEMFDGFLPTTLIDLLLVQCFFSFK